MACKSTLSLLVLFFACVTVQPRTSEAGPVRRPHAASVYFTQVQADLLMGRHTKHTIAEANKTGAALLEAFGVPKNATLLGATEEKKILGCYKSADGRGAGDPISTCGSGLEQSGLLCYPKCEKGYYGVGPVCWQDCPPSFTDSGVSCTKPSSYGRGTGFAWHFGDSLNDDGMFQRCQAEHGQGQCEKCLLMVYPKCAPGFHPVGCNVCSPDCQYDMTDFGVGCSKKSYGRGFGEPLGCPDNTEMSGALCYPKCGKGKDGVGPVCWQNECPSEFPDQCGPFCAAKDGCEEIGKRLSLSTGVLLTAVAGLGCAATAFATFGATTLACIGAGAATVGGAADLASAFRSEFKYCSEVSSA